MIDAKTDIYINQTGSFITGGPAGCGGMTGRKVISDTYGGVVRYGGGTLSGKGPTTADCTGAYLARYLAKNIVASGIASRCEVRLFYAIGLADPTSLMVDTFGTGKICDEIIADWLLQNY